MSELSRRQPSAAAAQSRGADYACVVIFWTSRVRHCSPEFRVRLCLMNCDRVIADAIQAAQHLLWHRYDLPDAIKVVRLRKLVRSRTVQSALQRSGGTLL